jgi:hypothetical protein
MTGNVGAVAPCLPIFRATPNDREKTRKEVDKAACPRERTQGSVWRILSAS